MAFTLEQEADILQAVDAFKNGQKISELPAVEAGEVERSVIEVETPSGVSKQVNIIHAVNAKQIACRRWNETLATPVGEAFGSIDFLRDLPITLGLGCYLVTDDRVRRKLDPTNHYYFADGAPAVLDGSMGQYMWCWNAHYFCTKNEGDYLYEAVSLFPLAGWTCYYVPSGGTSALGFGVLDRETNKLCSLISNDTRYRGGGNQDGWDGTYRSQLCRPVTDVTGTNFSVYARNRGVGWEAGWYIARAVQEYLFRIIMGTRNSQAAFNSEKDANGLYQGGLGPGVTDAGSFWGTFEYYPFIPCSAGVELADGVGVAPYNVIGSAGTTVYAPNIPVFFGLKHLYGHLYTHVRGLIIDVEATATGKARTYVAPSLYDYVPANDNTVAGMLLATEQLKTSGYIKKISTEKLCCMPAKVGGSSSTYFCDYYSGTGSPSSAALRCRWAGGYAGDTTYAGAFCTYAGDAPSVSYSGLSAPLCYFEEDPIMS